MEGEIYYPGYTLEREMSNFIKVWITVAVSLCYCYFSAKFIPKGMPRLLSIIPIVSLFLTLPLKLHSISLGGLTAFFVVWLSNFKLLLFAFDKGPLSYPCLSLPHFIVIACFPIRIQQNPPPKSPSNQERSLKSRVRDTSIWYYATKVVLLALLLSPYDYSDHIHPKVTLVFHVFYLYFSLETILGMVAGVARAILRLKLEPQFNKPYLSTSLQDFWGKRWNLVVSHTLRPAVYHPALRISARLMGRKWASVPAVMATFVVSALMHELIYYYLGRVQPTWEITWFFLLHGACVSMEIVIKKVVKERCRLPRFIATPMTHGALMVTGFWLFSPQLFRCKADVRSYEEFGLLGAFVMDVVAGVVKLKVQ